MTAERVAGLVLAGGASRRFGREKAVALLAGRPLLAWSLEALAPSCQALAVSARPGSGAEVWAREAGLPVLHDDPDHPRGPLAGLAAGLAWAAALDLTMLVTLPCDTPGIEPADVEALIEAAKNAPAAFVVTADGPHGLCAAWRSESRGELVAALEGGEHPPVRAILEAVGATPVRLGSARAMRNINLPEDLAELEGDFE